MTNLSITTAWNETIAFVKREAGLILPIAFLLIALPGALMQMLMPLTPPGETPEPGLWLLLLPVAIIAGMVGSIAITYLSLRPGASVEEALRVGLRRFIMLFAASLLVSLGFILAFVPLVLIFVGGAALSGNLAASAGSLVLLLLIFLVVVIAVWVRLMLMTPVAAVESAGPIEIIRRSWQLTAGHFWKLLGFIILLLIAAVVVIMVVSMVFGLLLFAIAGRPDPGSTSMILLTIVTAVIQAVLAAIFATLIGRIYHQLSGGAPEAVFA